MTKAKEATKSVETDSLPIADLSVVEGIDLLGKADILGAKDIRYQIVDVPEWNNGKTTKVLVKSLSGSERDGLEESMMTGKGKSMKMTYANFRAKLCARGIVDKEGNRVFTEAEIAALGKKSAAALARVSEVVTHLSGISKEDVDEIVGNSASEAGDDS